MTPERRLWDIAAVRLKRRGLTIGPEPLFATEEVWPQIYAASAGAKIGGAETVAAFDSRNLSVDHEADRVADELPRSTARTARRWKDLRRGSRTGLH